jgi:hypothetical protein
MLYIDNITILLYSHFLEGLLFKVATYFSLLSTVNRSVEDVFNAL